MKPKTIEEALEILWTAGEEYWTDSNISGPMPVDKAISTALAQIQQLLEECAPIKRTVIKDENLTSAGEQVRYRSLGFNQAIDQYKSNIREKLR